MNQKYFLLLLYSFISTFSSAQNNDVLYIPVVFHVVHDEAIDGDISDDTFLKLIKEINEGFNYVKKSNIDSLYRKNVASCRIIFYKADKDEKGNAIDFVSWHRNGTKQFFKKKYDKNLKRLEYNYKDSKKFLNIWVCNIGEKKGSKFDAIGGYVPEILTENLAIQTIGGTDEYNDGVVLNYDMIKNNNNRKYWTCHEIGHWLNLDHIWGSLDADDTSCIDSDNIKDTPNQGRATKSINDIQKVCFKNVNGNYQNFMDYSKSVGMFTNGQKEKMRDYILKKRFGLLWNQYGKYTDPRDNQEYDWIRIGSKKWMTKNLNYKTANSSCYNDKNFNCNKYGRLYNWEEAQKACPQGWSLPTEKDWSEMSLGNLWQAKKVKSTTGWKKGKNGINENGLNILPSGAYIVTKKYKYLGTRASFWLYGESSRATSVGTRTFTDYMSNDRIPSYGASFKREKLSCRCVQDAVNTSNKTEAEKIKARTKLRMQPKRVIRKSINN